MVNYTQPRHNLRWHPCHTR